MAMEILNDGILMLNQLFDVNEKENVDGEKKHRYKNCNAMQIYFWEAIKQ